MNFLKHFLLASILVGSVAFAAEKTADELIDKAVKEKKITVEEGFLFKIRARFNPDQVPSEYRGKPDEHQTHALMMAIKNMIGKVDANGQRELVGFMIPPSYKDSRLFGGSSKIEAGDKINKAENDPLPVPSANWKFVENTDVRVWWQGELPEDEGSAKYVLGIFPGIKAKLDALVGKTYVSDTGIHRFKDKEGVEKVWGDGGNGKLDIYIGPLIGALALTIAYPPGCSEAPAFMLLRSTMANGKYAEAALAHEYMHVLSFAHVHGRGCGEYEDVDEGIANWAINYVNPANNYEQEYDHKMLYAGATAIGDTYNNWPFFLFLEKTLGVQTIPAIFNNYHLLSNWEAVDQSIAGGLTKQWPLFTVRQWNQIAELEDFRDWDQFEQHPIYNNGFDEEIKPIEVKPNEKGNFFYEKEFKVRALAANFFHFKFTDPTIRSVTFEAIPRFEPTQKLKLKVLVKKFAKAWEVEDWGQKEETTEVCREVHDEKIEEIIFIFSNVKFPKKGQDWRFGSDTPSLNYEFNVQATNIACKKHLGTFKTIVDFKHTNGSAHYFDVDSKATFEPEGYNSDGHFIGRFWVTEGGGSFNYRGSVLSEGALCHGTMVGQFSIVTKKRGSSLGIYPHQAKPANQRRYSGAIGSIEPASFNVTYTCPGNKPPVTGAVTPIIWSTGMNHFVEPDGVMRGTYDINSPEGSVNYKWTIKPE